MKVKFQEWDCDVVFDNYREGNAVSIELIDVADGSPVARASTNLTPPVPDGYVAIKDYSENAGMLDCMIKAGIVSKPVKFVETGRVTIPVCKLLKRGD